MIEPFILLSFILILNSLAIYGVNVATDFETNFPTYKEFIAYIRESKCSDEHARKKHITDKMIGWKLRYWSLKYIGEFYSKPLFTCATCMASVHSTYFYLFFLTFVDFELKWILFWIPYVCVLAGLNYIVGKTLLK